MSAARPVLDTFRLDGRVAIVTGASRGLGAAMAGALAEAGAKVALAARGEMKEVRRRHPRARRRMRNLSRRPGRPRRAEKTARRGG